MSFWWLNVGYLEIGVLLGAVALDALLPEPPARFHPVVWMGKLISLLERTAPSTGNLRRLFAGVCMALIVPGVFGVAAWLLVIGLQYIVDLAYLVGGAVLLRSTFTVRGLGHATMQTQRALVHGELEVARSGIGSLVSRDATALDATMMAGAAVESVAENTTDSYVGPWLAFVLLGVQGAIVYRDINTLDSMEGYHGRYEYLGKASARLDDVINLLPTRLSALMLVLGGLPARLSFRQGWRWMLRDHGKTKSPNAGWTLSATAGLLGVVLVKPGHYRLGDGLREVEPSDITKAVRLSYIVAAIALPVVVGMLVARRFIVG